jgi:NADH-quinone oxidoreductase subunit L
VIHACHEEQDLRRMGGLWRKLPVTAFTMLAGVLAIIGTPFFSGWYSKDLILADALAFASLRRDHWALFAAPLATAALTAFYMPRLWLMAFAGRPRDEKVYAHAHESPAVMTAPLVVLAALSVCAAWGWPLWDPEASALGHLLHHAQPSAVELGEYADVRVEAAALHRAGTATPLALAAAGLGVAVALVLYGWRVVDPAAVRRAAGPVGTFLERRWLIDDLYRVAIVRPFLYLAAFCRTADKRSTDAPVVGTTLPAPPPPPTVAGEVRPRVGRADPTNVDGVIVLGGQAVLAAGLGLRQAQTGFLRHYVLVLVLTAVALFAILSYFSG